MVGCAGIFTCFTAFARVASRSTKSTADTVTTCTDTCKGPGHAEAVQVFLKAVLQNAQELEHVQMSDKEHIWLQVSLQSRDLKAHRHCASALFFFVHLILFVDQDGTHAESCIKMLTYANSKLSNVAAVLSGCL